MSIYEKLQKARVELQEKQLKKSGKNKYAGFTYFELADFLPTINKIFLELKLNSNFSIKEGLAVLTIIDWEDESLAQFTSPIETLELKGCTKIQALGGVHTYLKRYLYLNALEIVEADMLDAQAGNIEEQRKTKQATPKTEPNQDGPNTENKNTNPEQDLDIFQGLYETVSTTKALAYYREYQSIVFNPELFKEEYTKHYKKLKQKENQ